MSYAEDEHGEERMDEDEGVNAEQEEGEEEESRPLTHEEIWDDSALVDAWNSAEAEYEVSSPSSLRTRLLTSSQTRPTTARRKPGKQNP